MSNRTCEGCRWWNRHSGEATGDCQSHPPIHLGQWPSTDEADFCSQWADKTITAEEADRRELVRQFALAIVQGMYANPEDTSVQVAKQAQLFAREFQETMQEGQQ